jgi:hypothetical protein
MGLPPGSSRCASLGRGLASGWRTVTSKASGFDNKLHLSTSHLCLRVHADRRSANGMQGLRTHACCATNLTRTCRKLTPTSHPVPL